MRLILSCFILALSLTAFGQHNLSGTVSSDDRSKLESATIFLQGTNIAGVSEFDGTFLIENIPTGTYIIEFSYLGYEDQTQELTN